MAPGKPKIVGILSLVTSAITMIALPLLDGDPTTQPQYAAFVALAMSALGLLFARDNGKSSEDVGIK